MGELPNGADCCLQEAKKVKKFQALVTEVESAEPGPALDEACEQLQALVAGLKPAKGLLQQACAPRTALVLPAACFVSLLPWLGKKLLNVLLCLTTVSCSRQAQSACIQSHGKQAQMQTRYLLLGTAP